MSAAFYSEHVTFQYRTAGMSPQTSKRVSLIDTSGSSSQSVITLPQ